MYSVLLKLDKLLKPIHEFHGHKGQRVGMGNKGKRLMYNQPAT